MTPSAEKAETKGKFITLEGGEGSGKSTQSGMLADFLRQAGIDEVIETREPGGTPGAEEIRALLVTGEPGRWEPWTEALMMIAARRDHVSRLIRPALDRGAWVVCDRFSDSTLAYQGAAGGLGMAAVKRVIDAALGAFGPDLTLLIDVPVKEGLSRAGKRQDAEDRFEQAGVAFHEAVRHGFLTVARQDPDRIVTVDGTGNPEQVAAEIQNAVRARLLAESGV